MDRRRSDPDPPYRRFYNQVVACMHCGSTPNQPHAMKRCTKQPKENPE